MPSTVNLCNLHTTKNSPGTIFSPLRTMNSAIGKYTDAQNPIKLYIHDILTLGDGQPVWDTVLSALGHLL